ncbi:MAG: GGDEF domain-containing protein [Lachnospiraceae bacterium]|nr:GGDEF domain-containing protein [Lachnospiraceae bacterium]
MRRTDKKLTIGVLVSGILDDFTEHICNGIMAEARANNVDVLIFPGKYIDRDLSDDRELMYEYQYGTVFSYIQKGCLDALIVAADCIGCFTTPDRIRHLLQQYDGIPCVLIASKIDGYIGVKFENETGIREGLEYLIKNCGCRNIGMIGGHDNNTDALERREIFNRVLAENGLDCPPHRFAAGDLSSHSTSVYCAFLDANPDLDAVFCVNDDTALGLYTVLEERQIVPGRDISVLGFDDSPASAKASPPLATVLADPTQLGEASIRLILDVYEASCTDNGSDNILADTQAVSSAANPLDRINSISIPTHFVLRDSIVQANEGRKTCAQILSNLEVSFHDTFYHNYHAEAQLQMDEVRLAYGRLFDSLAACFMHREEYEILAKCTPNTPQTADAEHASRDPQTADTVRASQYSQLTNAECTSQDLQHTDAAEPVSNIQRIHAQLHEIGDAADAFLNPGVIGSADIDGLMTNLEQFYHALLAQQEDSDSRFELRNAFNMLYRKIIRTMNRQSASVIKKEYDTSYNMKLFVQNILQFEQGTDESFCSILKNLGWLEIQNAWLYLLPVPQEHLFREPFDPPQVLELKAVLKNGAVHSVPLPEQPQSLLEMYRFAKPDGDVNFAQAVLPLFSGKTVYGVLICDMTPSLYSNGEFLINQLSSAIKMISLLQANEKIQAQLEVNLETLKDHNIELDAISKSDPLTGILNVRGFYALAEEQIDALRREGRYQAVIYVDMNNLKLINDRFGHKEGDSSLRQIGRVLKEISNGRGIAGRIGGDEFTCLLEVRKPSEINQVNALNSACETEADSERSSCIFDSGESIIAALHQRFDRYNQTSEKPYLLTVSAGACLITPDDDITLKEALIRADQKLYEAKKTRSRDVMKTK